MADFGHLVGTSITMCLPGKNKCCICTWGMPHEQCFVPNASIGPQIPPPHYIALPFMLPPPPHPPNVASQPSHCKPKLPPAPPCQSPTGVGWGRAFSHISLSKTLQTCLMEHDSTKYNFFSTWWNLPGWTLVGACTCPPHSSPQGNTLP